MPRRRTLPLAALVLALATTIAAGSCAPITIPSCYAQDVTFLEEADDESVVEIALADCLSGNLFVENTEMETLSLPYLEDIGGALVISSNLILTRVELPLLTNVGLLLEVTANNELDVLSLPVLESVGGDLVVRNNPDLPLAATRDALADVEVGGQRVVQ